MTFEDASFVAATIAFGLRNLADPVQGLRERIRVARRAAVLEFVRPPGGVVGGAYRLYLKTVLPAIGGVSQATAPRIATSPTPWIRTARPRSCARWPCAPAGTTSGSSHW